MKRSVKTGPGTSRRTLAGRALCALTLAVVLSGCASAPPPVPPPLDVAALTAAGFKGIDATTPQQKEHLQRLAPGRLSAMERNGVPYYVYPDVPGNRLYVGAQKQYQAYLRLHPEGNVNLRSALTAQQAADEASYAKQDDAMRKATQRDLSDPYLFWPSFVEFVW